LSKDWTGKDKDKDKDLKLVLKESLRTRQGLTSLIESSRVWLGLVLVQNTSQKEDVCYPLFV